MSITTKICGIAFFMMGSALGSSGAIAKDKASALDELGTILVSDLGYGIFSGKSGQSGSFPSFREHSSSQSISLHYLYRLSDYIWAGPGLGMTLFSQELAYGVDRFEASTRSWAPGAALRFAHPTYDDRYIALGIGAYYHFLERSASILSGGTLTSGENWSGSGPGGSIGLSFGERFGDTKPVLFEVAFKYSYGRANEATPRDSTESTSISLGGFTAGISFGLGL